MKRWVLFFVALVWGLPFLFAGSEYELFAGGDSIVFNGKEVALLDVSISQAIIAVDGIEGVVNINESRVINGLGVTLGAITSRNPKAASLWFELVSEESYESEPPAQPQPVSTVITQQAAASSPFLDINNLREICGDSGYEKFEPRCEANNLVQDIRCSNGEIFVFLLKTCESGCADGFCKEALANENVASGEINDGSAFAIDAESTKRKSVLAAFPRVWNYRIYFASALLLLVLIFVGSVVFKYYKFKRSPKSEEHVSPFFAPLFSRKKASLSKEVDEALNISSLHYSRGNKEILRDVSFKVKRGELVSMIGGSGVGKSTLIESLVLRMKPSSGEILIFGENPLKNSGIFKHVGFVPQNNEIYLNQSVMQNMINSATKWGVPNAGIGIEEVLKQIKLANRKNVLAKDLSGGQKKLLSLGMELIHEPELLILDEPTTGLDPKTRNDIIVILGDLTVKDKKTVFFSTHFMDDAEECDEIIILGKEGVLAQKSPSKLKKTLPGGGKIVSVTLDNVTNGILENIKALNIGTVIREGRDLKIITEKPSAVHIAEAIENVGGVVNATEVVTASIKEVFIYYTGETPEEQ